MANDHRVPGGHLVQLEQTKKHLTKLGAEVDIALHDAADLVGYDVIHGFGLTPEQIRRCRVLGTPVALSTIYWNKAYVTGRLDSSLSLRTIYLRLRMGASLLVSALKGDHSQKAEALIAALMSKRVAYEMADLLLPNSELEAQAIKSDLAVTTPYHVVPNSVDHVAFTFDPTEDQSHRDHVLYAGRFEPHKNQLALIEAMRHSSIPVVLVGPTHPDHLAYYERCKSRLSNNIKIVPGVPHDQLGPLYRAAKVHVLPSGFETTGLVSLEAALCGCNIVTTDRGYARDYFKDMAYYCAPNDPESIRRAVTAAFEAPYSDELRQHILKNFIWEETARATLEAYVKLVSCRRGDEVGIGSASSAR